MNTKSLLTAMATPFLLAACGGDVEVKSPDDVEERAADDADRASEKADDAADKAEDAADAADDANDRVD